MNQKKLTRRDFMKQSIKFMAAAFIFPFLITRNKKAEGKNPEAKSKKPLEITLDLEDTKYSALKKTGGSVYVQIEGEARPAIVYRISEKEIAAYSSRCTHMGCKVELPKNGKVVCNCHNSVFDAYGKRLSGPAKENLEPFSVELRGSTITISRS